MKKSYDIIICGAGCAGLSLAYRLCDPSLKNLSILIIEPEAKTQNDRTWSFWEKDQGIFDSIVSKRWKILEFHSQYMSKELQLDEYEYKMIKASDFYEHCKEKISTHGNIEWISGRVKTIEESSEYVTVHTDHGIFTGDHVFKNFHNKALDKSKPWYVDQHFGGWFIKTKEHKFDPHQAVFMDFRIDQADDIRFFYVLPRSKTEALVEIAIFSNDLMTQQEYDKLIANYIKEYIHTDEYDIEEREYGVIPMTSQFINDAKHSTKIINIGTPSGAVKASSGYAFYRIQKQCQHIVDSLKAGNKLTSFFKKDRFSFYDQIMLNVLLTKKVAGDKVFTDLFRKLPVENVLTFLNEETNLAQEIKIFTAPPWAPFTKAMMEEII